MRRAIVTVGAAGTAAGLAGLGALAARRAAARIRRTPDRVPLERLGREPRGREAPLARPDGTRLRVVTAGPPDAPPVVLAHGIALQLREWNLVWERLLAEGFRVVAFDQRGHGRSTIGSAGVHGEVMAADYLAVLESVGASGAILVGHSMGGFLSLRAVLDLPGVSDRLAGLVLVSAFGGDVLSHAPQNVAEAPVLGTGLLDRIARSPTAGTLLGASFFGPHPQPAMVQALLEMVLECDLVPLRALGIEFLASDMTGRLDHVRLPTVVVCGSADRTTPLSESAQLAEGIPGARLRWVAGAGHMLPWEAPESVVAAIREVDALARRASGPCAPGNP